MKLYRAWSERHSVRLKTMLRAPNATLFSHIASLETSWQRAVIRFFFHKSGCPNDPSIFPPNTLHQFCTIGEIRPEAYDQNSFIDLRLEKGSSIVTWRMTHSHNSVTSHTQISDLFEGLILRSHPIGSKSKCNRVSQPPRRL